jgi:hypothetical protein
VFGRQIRNSRRERLIGAVLTLGIVAHFTESAKRPEGPDLLAGVPDFELREVALPNAANCVGVSARYLCTFETRAHPTFRAARGLEPISYISLPISSFGPLISLGIVLTDRAAESCRVDLKPHPSTV